MGCRWVPGCGVPGSLTEIWFDGWADHDAFFTSENYRTVVDPDEATVIDITSVGVMVTEEKIVV